MNDYNLIPKEVVLNNFHHLRGQTVMLDRDLAKLYGVETKYLKRQVRRNLARFPDDFMFEMTPKEFVIKVNDLENRMGKQDGKIKLIFEYLKQFVQQQKSSSKVIGFKLHSRPNS